MTIEEKERFKKRVQKEIDYASHWLSNIEPTDVIRIFGNLMEYGIAKIILGKYFLNNFERYEKEIENITEEYKKFAFELRGDSIEFRTTGAGYHIGTIYLTETKSKFMAVDEEFSIKNFREYVSHLLNGEYEL